jgi:hypothetical protein
MPDNFQHTPTFGFTQGPCFDNPHLIPDLTLIVLIMRVVLLGSLHHAFIDRVPHTSFYSDRDRFVHAVTNHFAEQNLTVAICHSLRPLMLSPSL